MSSVAERLEAVRARVAVAERSAGRPQGSVTLVAVSKTKPIAAIEAAYAAGQRDFGENYAQELDRKARALAHLPGLRWHFIGNLQRNKAKVIAAHAHVLHTLDSLALAHELEKRLQPLGRSLTVLVEVNVSGEPQKHGVTPSLLATLLSGLASLPRLEARGFMTVPPADDDARAATCFRTLADLAHTHRAHLRGKPLLSMGMSDDLELAVREGATHVRVGTAIFGPRSLAGTAAPSPHRDRVGGSSDS
jgi:pyridoxal phosphate enzyme (YggS family)